MGGALPSNGLLRMCRCMGAQFHDWIDNNGVAFSGIFNGINKKRNFISGILGEKILARRDSMES